MNDYSDTQHTFTSIGWQARLVVKKLKSALSGNVPENEAVTHRRVARIESPPQYCNGPGVSPSQISFQSVDCPMQPTQQCTSAPEDDCNPNSDSNHDRHGQAAHPANDHDDEQNGLDHAASSRF